MNSDKNIMKTIKFYFSALALFLTVFMYSCASKSETKPEEEGNFIPVKTIVPEKVSIAFPINSTGILASSSEIKLSFKTGGLIANIYKKEGQYVQKGELLATLNLSEINSQVSQARAALEKAERDLSRVKNLFKDTVATLEQLQNVTTQKEVSTSNLEIALFNQKYSKIIAPVSGVLLKQNAEEGELTGPGAPIFVLASSEDNWVVNTGIADRDVVNLNLGDSAKLQFDAFRGKIFYGSISKISQSPSMTGGAYEVEISLFSKPKRWVSGLVSQVEIIPSAKASFFLIPVESLVEADGSKGFVYKVGANGTEVIKTSVQISEIYKDKVAIGKGLAEGEQIVNEGAAYLTATSKIKIIR